MACQLGLLVSFQDIESIKTSLFPKLKSEEVVNNQKSAEDELDDWDNADWGWKVDDDEQTSSSTTGNGGGKEEALSWLQECLISISPVGQYLVLAREDRLLLLEQRWDPRDKMDKFMLVEWDSDRLAMEDSPHDRVAYRANRVQYQSSSRELITSVLCLPLASHKRSTQGGPDGTVVIVGFNSGYVRIYTEGGKLLLSQIFSEEPVVKIKCRTYEPPRHTADAEKHEELTILYKRALVTIDGFSFFQSLQACRRQVARAAASGHDLIQPPPLAYKKWGLQDQDQINDHISCGIRTPNPFDQMQIASMLSGPYASIKATPPASHLYLTGGMGPYTGVFYAVEGSSQPMLSDVAHAVASKLKSALFSQISAASGWFGIKQSQENHREKRPKIEPATALPTRFGLPDKRRIGQSIVLSPDNKLAATTDSFGRVVLIDIDRGVATRMWKGYRDAQVGWVQVKEDRHPEQSLHVHRRRALFFIIYAPRRGILEVWTSQQGPRVAAFNVSKYCHLLCPGYGMMGLNIVTCHEVKVHMHQCFLIDPDAGIKTIDIPFHLALSDKNSKRARDLHLLKKLKLALRETNSESGGLQTEVIDTLLDMRIGRIKQQGVERVLHTKYLTAGFLQAVIRAVSHQLEVQARESEEQEEESQLDYESRMLLQFCKSKERLIQTYTEVQLLQSHPPPDAATQMNACKVLGVSSDELTGLQSQLDEYDGPDESASKRVKFEADPPMDVVKFLICSECVLLREGSLDEQSDEEKSKYAQIGNFLFKQHLENGMDRQFGDILKNSAISPEKLLTLLLHTWLQEDKRSLEETHNLFTLIQTVTNLKDLKDVDVGHNELSPWWEHMRTQLASSEQVRAALLAALVGRSVAQDLHIIAKVNSAKTVTKASSATSQPTKPNEDKMSSSTESGQLNLSEWESVTIDRTQWTVLIKQLDDLLVFQTLLKTRPNVKPSSPSAVRPPDNRPILVSVKRVLDGGRRVLPELVAQWITAQLILPRMLCLSQDATEQEEVEKGQEVTESTKLESSNPIITRLQAVQKRLPHSLGSDILMANCAWEYGVLWNKDPEVIFPLEQAVEYLKCINNGVLQHGVASMMWRTFMLDKIQASAKLMEKVGKSPREYLCRRDIGLNNVALKCFIGLAVEILDTMIQSRHDAREVPVFNVEDLWVSIQGPTSLVELAAEQETNLEIVEHHFQLCVVMFAVLSFSMKSVKPLSMFDEKDRDVFFRPLDSKAMLQCRVVEESIRTARKAFLSRVITQAVLTITSATTSPLANVSSSGVKTSPPPSICSTPPSSPPPSSPLHKSGLYARWVAMVMRLAKELCVEEDDLRRHHVCELYSTTQDKVAEEVLLSVNDHPSMGYQLLLIAGQRLANYIFENDPSGGVETRSKCSPTMSTWLKSMDTSLLRNPSVPIQDIAALLAHVVNQLPESHSEYNRAISLVDLIQLLM